MNALQTILCMIAARVAYGLYKKENMWHWVTLYWAVLLAMNVAKLIN